MPETMAPKLVASMSHLPYMRIGRRGVVSLSHLGAVHGRHRESLDASSSYTSNSESSQRTIRPMDPPPIMSVAMTTGAVNPFVEPLEPMERPVRIRIPPAMNSRAPIQSTRSSLRKLRHLINEAGCCSVQVGRRCCLGEGWGPLRKGRRKINIAMEQKTLVGRLMAKIHRKLMLTRAPPILGLRE